MQHVLRKSLFVLSSSCKARGSLDEQMLQRLLVQTLMHLGETIGLKAKLRLRASELYRAGQPGWSVLFVWPLNPVRRKVELGFVQLSAQKQ